MIFKTFGWSFAVTAVALTAAFALGGTKAFVLVAILCVLEISLSFDNAVINATILVRMNAFWQKMFLSVGVIIAVFGMRLIFPLLIVGVTAHLNPVAAVRLALDGGGIETPGTYAYALHAAHPSIAAFGGMFLLMIFLDFIFEDREISWLSWLERPLARIGKLDQLSVIVAASALATTAELFAKNVGTVMVSGTLGIVTYLLVNALGELFEAGSAEEVDVLADDIESLAHVESLADIEELADMESLAGIHGDAAAVDASLTSRAVTPVTPTGPNSVVKLAGKAAFFLFLYIEVLDASFSFDGVIGAFAITQDIFIIAVGLGVGAMYIRSLTVYLVRQGTLSDYVFLEHGAHWAIGALAVILLVGVKHEAPEIVTGLLGVGFIGAAFLSSLIRNKRVARGETPEERRERELVEAAR